jgi:hypothetical protein
MCHLFDENVDSKHLVASAERRWEMTGQYTWQMAPELSERLTKDLREDSTDQFEEQINTEMPTFGELPDNPLLSRPRTNTADSRSMANRKFRNAKR